jgi:hypothetical protein
MDIKEWIAEHNEEALIAEGFDAAIVGVVVGVVEGLTAGAVVVYDAAKCISILMDRDRMTHADAVEFFEFNVAGSYMGENTPLWLWRPEMQNEWAFQHSWAVSL